MHSISQVVFANGFDYYIANLDNYMLYLAESDRYPVEIALYETLFSDAELIKEFPGSLTKAGPTIRVYKLSP